MAQDLCEKLNIKRFYEGSLTSNPVTAKDIFEILNHEGSKTALAIGFINRSPLNRIVREFKDQESTSLSPDKYIFDNILESVGKSDIKNKL